MTGANGKMYVLSWDRHKNVIPTPLDPTDGNIYSISGHVVGLIIDSLHFRIKNGQINLPSNTEPDWGFLGEGGGGF